MLLLFSLVGLCLFFQGYAGLTDHHHVVHIPESLENVMMVLTMGDRAWWVGCFLGGLGFPTIIFLNPEYVYR